MSFLSKLIYPEEQIDFPYPRHCSSFLENNQMYLAFLAIHKFFVFGRSGFISLNHRNNFSSEKIRFTTKIKLLIFLQNSFALDFSLFSFLIVSLLKYDNVLKHYGRNLFSSPLITHMISISLFFFVNFYPSSPK